MAVHTAGSIRHDDGPLNIWVPEGREGGELAPCLSDA